MVSISDFRELDGFKNMLGRRVNRFCRVLNGGRKPRNQKWHLAFYLMIILLFDRENRKEEEVWVEKLNLFWLC